MDNFTVQAAEVRDYGEDGAQYFAGLSTYGTPWTRAMLGVGDTAREALEDALEQMATADATVSPTMAAQLLGNLSEPDKSAHDSLDAHDCEKEDGACGEWQHYIAIFYNLKSKESGYTACACRDCFDIAIGIAGEAMCNDCEEAGCEAGEHECCRSDAYGCEETEED